jgi:predicted ribosomally synthesized peptide with SipW-like signal peptide
MLVGTTFAWFTDTVTSANNIIQTGTLKVGLSYSDDNTTWNSVTDAKEPVFNYQFWEPGYTEIKYVKISNNGTLAFKYQLNIVPNTTPAAGEPNLADVIDVYLFPADVTVTKDVVAAATPVGTLSDLIAENDGAAHGVLLPAPGVSSTDVNTADDSPRGEVAYCIALRMRNVGNEYRGLSVGDGFALQLLATQYTWENDSFDHLYDEGADFKNPPRADVQVTSGKLISTSTHGDIWANTTFQFQPSETLDEALKNPYKLYHADFVVKSDKDIAPNTIVLPGYYTAYCDDYNDGKWLGLSSDDTITAGTELRLIQILGEALGGSVTVNYEDICRWGNDGIGFLCGVAARDLDNDGIYDAAGATLTVELRLYEVPAQGECANGGGCEHDSYGCETGADNYVTIGTYKYTVPTEVEGTNP